MNMGTAEKKGRWDINIWEDKREEMKLQNTTQKEKEDLQCSKQRNNLGEIELL